MSDTEDVVCHGEKGFELIKTHHLLKCLPKGDRMRAKKMSNEGDQIKCLHINTRLHYLVARNYYENAL